MGGADLKVLQKLPTCCREQVDELGSKGGLAKEAKKLFEPAVDLNALKESSFDESMKHVEGLAGRLKRPGPGTVEAVKLEICRKITCAHFTEHKTSSKREQETLAKWWEQLALALETKCAEAHGGTCQGVTGEWVEAPMLKSVDASYVGVADDQDLAYFDFVPDGVKVYIKIMVTGVVAGVLRCNCQAGGDHGWSGGRRFEFPVAKLVKVPVKFKVWKLLLRFIPYAGQAYAVYDLARKGEKIVSLLRNIERVAPYFDAAVRVMKESADLICQGRFNQGELAAHVMDIVIDELGD